MRYFEPREYGGHLQVWAIVQDSRGLMYFGTTYDLVEFDGTNWRRLDFPKGKTARSLCRATDGTIYVGGTGEIGRLAADSAGQVHYVSLNPHLPQDHKSFNDVLYILDTTHGVYFMAAQQTFRWHNQQISVLPIGAHRPAVLNDVIYIDGDESIATIKDGVLSTLTDLDVSEEAYGSVRLFPSFDPNRLFLWSSKKGLHFLSRQRLAENSWKTVLEEFPNQASDYLRRFRVFTATLLAPDQIAFGTLKGGVVIINTKGELIQIVNENRGLASNTVFFIQADRFNNLWAGLQGGIAHIVASSPLSLYGKLSGLKSTVLAVTRHHGTIYAGTYISGTSYLPEYHINLDDEAHRFVKPKGHSDEYAWIFLPVEDTLLVSQKSVSRIDDRIKKVIKGTPGAYDMCASKRFENRIYLGLGGASGGGIGILEHSSSPVGGEPPSTVTKFKYRGRLEGIKEVVRGVVEDRDGHLWVSTDVQGLLRLRFNSPSHEDFIIDRYTTDNGLPSLDQNKVFADEDQVLVATQNNIYKFIEPGRGPDPRIHFVPVEAMNEVLPDDLEGASDITKYNENTWLVGPFRTHGMLTRQPDNRFRADSRPFRSIYDQQSGEHVDSDGVIWIPTKQGLYRFDANKDKDYDAPFSAIIRGVRTNLGRQLFKGTFYDPDSRAAEYFNRTQLEQPTDLVPTLTYEENALSFDYSALFFEQMDRTTYQTMLEGFDQDWNDWSNKTHKEYTNIPEGTYTFKVRAKTLYDAMSSVATYRFKIQPPWYRTVWAYLGYLLLFLLVLQTGIKLNTRRLRAAKKQLEKVVKERTAEVVSQKKELEVAYHEVNEAKDALWGEMKLAKKIQTVLLPEAPKIPGFEITGYMKTADEVGGDYYDVIERGGRHWVVIGDVSGHGVPAGLVMMMVQTAINQVLELTTELALNEVLEAVNRVIYENIKKLGQSKYMTLTLMLIDADGSIYYCGLHQNILTFRASTREVESVETQGMWLGIVEDIKGLNEVNSFTLHPGDTMLLHTDGIIESRNAQREMYGIDHLRNVYASCGGHSPEEIKDHILSSLEGFDCDDDLTLLVIKKCEEQQQSE